MSPTDGGKRSIRQVEPSASCPEDVSNPARGGRPQFGRQGVGTYEWEIATSFCDISTNDLHHRQVRPKARKLEEPQHVKCKDAGIAQELRSGVCVADHNLDGRLPKPGKLGGVTVDTFDKG